MGDAVRVVTSSGQSWVTRATEVVGRTRNGLVVRTEGRLVFSLLGSVPSGRHRYQASVDRINGQER